MVWGRPEILYSKWQEPIFSDGVNSSKVRWHVNSSLFVVLRSVQRDKHTRNFRVWHSRTEFALTATRMQKAEVPPKKTKKKRVVAVSEDRYIIPETRRYTAQFAKKYGSENGKPTNCFVRYEPPVLHTRLRDYEGTPLRKNAEKSMVLCEYAMDLFTNEGDVVLDLFAGTASMGTACIKGKRRYLGCEPEIQLVNAARLRLGKTYLLLNRGVLGEAPGMSRSFLEQVFCLVLHL